MPIPLAAVTAGPMVSSPVGIFLVVMALILCVPMALSRLKIPHVIGLILAGVAVGPHGFNVLARDMSFEVFGQVGLLYLMFLAGVEIDMYHLKKNLRRGMVFGFYTFFIPVALGVAAAMTLMGMGVVAALMMASMMAAHTLLAYPIVSRLGLTKNPAVIIAIAGTIFTVLGSLMVLAGAASVVRVGEFRWLPMMRLIGLVVVYCAVVVYVYPRLTRWFFKRYNDGVMQYVYVMVMMFLAASVAKLIGIEAVFGAFFSGIVLNRYIPGRSPLMARIVFVGNAIFIPYFLLGVGMLIDVGALTRGWSTLYVAAVMSCVAMAGKWVAAFATQKTFGMRPIDRSILYQLSNAHTAVALAVVTIGYELGAFDEAVLNGTVIMILVTCTVSSVGTSRAASQLKVMSLSHKDVIAPKRLSEKGEKTLIPVVNPQTARELVNLALMINDGNWLRNKLYALHVRNDNTASSRAVGKSSLDVAQHVAASVDVQLKTIERFDMNFVTGVLNTIEEREISEVVIGLHRRSNVIDSFFGDKITQLLKATYKMVMISRCYIPINTIRRIVVVVPAKAQFETGFSRWVRSLGNLTRQLGCKIIFCCGHETRRYIRAVMLEGKYEIRVEYRDMETWDDFVLLSNRIVEDDLFVAVSARRASVSFNSDLDSLPEFLRKYFSSNNIIVIFPEQFGDEEITPTMVDALAADVETAPVSIWKSVYMWVQGLRRKDGDKDIEL